MLQYGKDQVGLAVLNSRIYLSGTQLQHFMGWASIGRLTFLRYRIDSICHTVSIKYSLEIFKSKPVGQCLPYLCEII